MANADTSTAAEENANKQNVQALTAREERAIYHAMCILEASLKAAPIEEFNSPAKVRKFLTLKLAREERELFIVMFLDAQHRLIAAETMFYGTLTQTIVHPREVVKRALHHNAAAVILAHNHPSGITDPSEADQTLTEVLKHTLSLVDVHILDHFVVAGSEALSLEERRNNINAESVRERRFRRKARAQKNCGPLFQTKAARERAIRIAARA